MTAESTQSEIPPRTDETLARRLSSLAHKLNRPSRLTLLSYALCAPLLLLQRQRRHPQNACPA